MSNAEKSIADVLAKDARYQLEAYRFVFQSLNYAHSSLGLGSPLAPGEEAEAPEPPEAEAEEEAVAEAERHLTGQELCEAIRLFALDQFGFLAKSVLNSWGVHNTTDFGNIVYNLIEANKMRKTKSDRREDFDDVFDFEQDMHQKFRIELEDE
jgi:uncharacterized repeat protein (TIGR04138 family)